MTVKLKDLYFGRVDGDTESNNKNFLDLFYTGNNKYDEIRNDMMKFLIHGKKGTGKTILGRYLERKYNNDGIYCKIYNKDDLVLGKLIEKENNSLEGEEAIYLYKWILYYMIYNLIRNEKISLKFNKNVIKNLKDKRRFNKSLKFLKNLYDTRYPNGNVETIAMVTDEEEEITANIEAKKSVLKSVLGSRRKLAKNKTFKRTEFYKLISLVEENIIECLKLKPVVIILDDLDELNIDFNTENNSIIALNKLIEAFKAINLLFVKNNVDNCKCILLIRTDIIKQLNKFSPNLNKIIQDNSVELYWIEKNSTSPEKHPLMEMILNKVKKTSKEFEKLSYSEIYKILFPESIHKSSAIDYMINNSFGRPRDIISYLEIIKRRYGEESSFKATMFKECNQSYSDKFLDELYNEMTIHIELKKLEAYIKLLRDFGKNKFFISDLKRYYKNRRKNYEVPIDMNEFGNTLYKIGIIGNVRTVGKGTTKEKTHYTWGYRNDGNPTPNLEIKFSVHYGFRNTLNVK